MISLLWKIQPNNGNNVMEQHVYVSSVLRSSKKTLGMSMQMQPSKDSLSAPRVCALSFHCLNARKLTVVVVSISLSLRVFN